MSRLQIKRVGAAVMLAAGAAWPAMADDEYSARLDGFQEVGTPGAILTKGSGKVTLNVHKTSISYKLKYSGLGSAVTQAHIHFGREHVAGGIMVFFCTNLGNGPAGTPACPETGGTVSGTITGSSVVGPTGQNVTAGNFAALISALEADAAYANVHTTLFPSGEVRGQLRKGDHDD